MTSDPFWTTINRQLDHIEAVKPNTASHVIDILNDYRMMEPAMIDGEAFFEGSGGDRQLSESLILAGWRVQHAVADYHWCVRHPDTNEHLTYIEGDVYTGNLMTTACAS